MILCRSVHKYITFCSEPLIRTLIRRIKCRISASQTFITYTMRIKSANITQKNKIFLFFFKNGCFLICLRIFIRISTVSYSSHSHQRSQHNYWYVCVFLSGYRQSAIAVIPTSAVNITTATAAAADFRILWVLFPSYSRLSSFSFAAPVLPVFSVLAASLKSPVSLSRVINRSYPARIFSSDSSGNSSHEVLPATFSNADSSILVLASYCSWSILSICWFFCLYICFVLHNI